ncbi:MAG: geranylgeranylglyceryl/heptaprenylglyceryl phosphate synthase [Aequorivita sp.]|nr:geranylgeranylglyceryl/heptaprenylglyceryl phosphate synthase [Aequorivita sp.]MAO47841.1 geranylgeranylglyceryl/heptaprenylglyceryl phosphate synthase [Aequorivita sp.]MBF31616.1 geranylgeranylglyceryl/heptaprenylglyceryl phosphate synthase [Aequorivita sp.]HAV53322.1 geranylgeranylglyceryl/heptaprenylglyceryl phosphate synthase [Aequorivita sp.]HBL79671.1 geranylgeranylglyceryl/heptaprenylglyceryl phosphate synthase [Aequorivita sp.]|tara:strand:- start:62541 stop:63257 length:717 start_codon:yes stop_codon:yes gene_type:complete
MEDIFYKNLLKSIAEKERQLAILIDPDKFNSSETDSFLKKIPKQTTHLFVGGSTVANGETEATVKALKVATQLPIFLFPGDWSHITHFADALLFLTLLSGRNAEYLVGQQIKSISKLKNSSLEIISTGYILIDGGNGSAVSKVTNTEPLPQENIENIVHTALAGQFIGAKIIYLEAGSGAKFPVKPEIISEVKKAINIPLIVGGGIKTEAQNNTAYEAGADMVVMGTAFEKSHFDSAQ